MSQPATAIRPDYIPHARAERLIAAGRFVLAFSSLAAVYVEPSTPVAHQQTTYTLLLIYTAYALVTVALSWRRSVPSAQWRLLSHALDLVLFSLFVYLTEGPASPFFLYFVFSLFCATLRFTWRGILATGIAAMAIYGAMAILASLQNLDVEMSRVLIRQAYLAVIAALLVYLGVHEQRMRRELASLAAWPRDLAADVESVLRAALAHAGGVLESECVLLIWEEREEPWIWVASWSNEELRLERVPPGELELPGRDLANTSYFVRGADEWVLVYDPATSTAGLRKRNPIGSTVRLRLGIYSTIGVSMHSEAVTAHMLVPGARNATADDLALAHIVARLVLATLEQFLFLQQVKQTASGEERLRISRELHDGIVQSLGGVGLQLQAIRSDLPSGWRGAERLEQVQRVIEHDQRELRAIVRELRPQDDRDGDTILRDELRRVRERFALEWGLIVDVDLSHSSSITPRLAHELSRIVNESLSNAARHGGASHAFVRITPGDSWIELRVSDNGRGFPFTGRYDLPALERSGQGPRTLKERIVTLGGSMTVDSSSMGSAIEARLPLVPEAAR